MLSEIRGECADNYYDELDVQTEFQHMLEGVKGVSATHWWW